MNKKIVFIPGWMYSPAYFKLSGGLDIWKEDIDLNVPVEGEYLVGHSMGAAVALKLWSLDKNKNLILVDPFIEQKNVCQTFISWLKFFWHEKINCSGLLGVKYVLRNMRIIYNFPQENYWEILKNVPKEKIKILHGEEDLFLCGPDICDKFRKLGFEIIEVPGAGHYWHKNFDDIIEKIINS